MRNLTILVITIAAMAASCNPDRGTSLLISNPLEMNRDDAVIMLTRATISGWTDIPPGTLPLLTLENGRPLPCQPDDPDMDGEWDELVALADLEPSGQMVVFLSFVTPESYPSFKPRTNLRLGSNEPGYPELLKAVRLEGISYHNYDGVTSGAYQMEGPAWENDRVGFRNYLDQRNGLDIFGKVTSEMILDSVGIAGRPSYHEPGEWGMDVLKVGTSLGAGGIGYLYNDSIYRVGDNGAGTYEVHFEGPLRSRILLAYSPWKVEENNHDVNHEIEILAGQRCYQSRVTYSGTGSSMDLVAGIVNMKSDSLLVLELNDRYTGLLTHDDQSEDTTLLAMALMVPTEILETVGESNITGEGITETYYAVLEAKPGIAVPYRFYSLWEKEDPRWASTEEVIGFLRAEADRWAHPVEISLTSEPGR